MTTELRKAFEDHCRSRGVKVPAQYRLFQAGVRRNGEWKPVPELLLYWNRRLARWGFPLSVRFDPRAHSVTGVGVFSALGELVTKLVQARVALETAQAQKEAERQAHAAHQTSRQDELRGALKKLGLACMPSELHVMDSAGQRLITLRIARFDGADFALYVDSAVSAEAVLRAVATDLHLEFEGEQELGRFW